MVMRLGRNPTRLSSAIILAAVVATVDGPTTRAADRPVVLGYVCASYASARRVAVAQGWEHPETLPGDCRSLLRLGHEQRAATISEVIEVLPIGGGRWVEIGRVRRAMVEHGYSAGIVNKLLLF